MEKLILCDIGETVTFSSGGEFRRTNFDDIFLPENRMRIYRIQFHTPPQTYQFERIAELIGEIPKISLRFCGQFSEDQIPWRLLTQIQRLQIDLWETDNLNELRNLPNLKELGISKQVRSKVSLSILKNLPNLEVLFTSVSKDIESISELKKLKFLSLNEIKTRSLDFLQHLALLKDLWLSLGSINSFESITNNKSIRNLKIHQVRGLLDQEAERMLSKGEKLTSLSLENLNHLTHLTFVKHLTELRYLNLCGIKNLKTYEPIVQLHPEAKITTYNSKPADQSILALQKFAQVWIGDSYNPEILSKLVKSFEGRILYYRGKPIRGEWIDVNPFTGPL
jgi:hypothetical protein